MSAGSYCKRVGWGQQKPPLGYQLDRSSPFAQGLVVCWLFNEGAGGIVNDLINNHALDVVGKPAKWTPNHLSVTGSASDYLISDIGATIVDYTIIVAANSVGVENPIISIGNAGVNYCVQFRYNGVYYATSDARDVFVNYNTLASSTDNTVAFIKNTGTNYGVFQNGLIVQNDAYVAPYTIPQQIGLGINVASTIRQPNSGILLYVYFFSRALSPAEVQYLYEQPYCMVEGYNCGRWFSIPSNAFILSPYWQNTSIQDAA